MGFSVLHQHVGGSHTFSLPTEGCPYSQVDGACGESGDNPVQVQGFEGDQDHAHILCQLFVALRVNEVVSGLAPNI